MGFWKDFKQFAMRGNIVDLAVGVVIGGAFGKIVTSLVSDLIMPLVSLATGNVTFGEWKYVFSEAVYEGEVLVKAENALLYGNFIQVVVDFLIIAFSIFLVLRIMMKLKKKQAEAPQVPPAPTRTEILLEEIRDLIKKDESETAASTEEEQA